VLAGGTVPVTVEGLSEEAVLVGADDVIVTQTPRAGWAVATDAGETVAIDTTITPELRREGLAREVIRLVQEARKTDGLVVTDRIALRWSASDPDLAAALTEHAPLIASEVLATQYGPEVATGDAAEHAETELGLRFWLRRARLLGSLIRLVRQARPAGGAANFPGGTAGHLLQVALAHKADEDAVGVVIPGDSGDHGYF
jgi:isoleucyl-tRNA synthetase